jgi:hypothetical protein
LVTGLIGAFLSTFFRIPGVRAGNQKSPVLRGGKPALLFPFGWQIVFEMGWSMRKQKEGLFWGCGFSGDREFPLKPLQDLLFYLHHFSVGNYLPREVSQPQKITNS